MKKNILKGEILQIILDKFRSNSRENASFMIPENKMQVVRKGLLTAFGIDEFEEIQPILIGLSSAKIFRIVVGGNPYLLRVITRTDPMADPSHYFRKMEMAAKEGITPPIFYLNVEDRISITGFITEQPFHRLAAVKTMPGLLQKLHSLPKFPRRIHYFDTMEGFIEKFQATQMLPEEKTKEVLEFYKQIARIYPRNDFNDWVCCHNDLKPENLLFDGQRPWIVDWESAFLNDRYLDLAVVTNFLVKNEPEETVFLQQYFGRPASAYQMARHFLMGMLLHVYYFTFLMLSAYKGSPVDQDPLVDEDFSSFHDRTWNGEINLAEDRRKRQYAWIHRNELLRKIRTRRYEDSMRILSGP